MQVLLLRFELIWNEAKGLHLPKHVLFYRLLIHFGLKGNMFILWSVRKENVFLCIFVIGILQGLN